MRVAFWGTPEFAAPALRALGGEGFEVVGVVTQPDKPQGRSREIIPSPVKQIAIDEEIPLFQPKNARDPELVDKLKGVKPDISVVVAYGHILPKELIDVIWVNPGTCPNCFSSGAVTADVMTSGPAPG